MYHQADQISIYHNIITECATKLKIPDVEFDPHSLQIWVSGFADITKARSQRTASLVPTDEQAQD